MCHLACWHVECILKIKVLSKLTHQPSWTHLIQMSLYYVLRLWHHSCKGCALPPSLLFQYLILNQNAYLNFFNLINNMKTGPFHKSLGLLLWVFWGSPPCFDQQPRPRQTLLHAFFFQCQVVAVFFFFLIPISLDCVHAKSFQLCLTLCDPMDCSLLGSSVHEILQARILEWIAMPFSRGIFPTQGLNRGLLYCRQILYNLSH